MLQERNIMSLLDFYSDMICIVLDGEPSKEQITLARKYLDTYDELCREWLKKYMWDRGPLITLFWHDYIRLRERLWTIIYLKMN